MKSIQFIARLLAVFVPAACIAQGSGYNAAHALSIAPDGSIVISGISRGSGDNADILTIRYSSDGEESWSARYDRNGGMESPIAVHAAADGRMTVAGFRTSTSGACDALLVRYTLKKPVLALSQRSIAFGNVTVGKSKALPLTISNSGSDTLSVMAIMSSNTVFTFGLNSFTLIPSASMVDSLRFAPTSIGAVSAVMTIASNASTSPDTIFVTGTGDPATSVRDMTALGFTLKQNYPNPVFTSTTFEFTIPRASRVNLEVFNILGVKVAALMDQQLDPGTHQVLWKNISLADGMYVYRLRTGGIVLSRPLIINRERK